MSKWLYQVIGIRLGKVSILIPPHWKTTSTAAYTESPESADIQIHVFQGKNLYTQHIQGCGRKALFMAISALYVSNEIDNTGL